MLYEIAKKLANALEVDGLGGEAQGRKGTRERDEMLLLNGTRLTDALPSKMEEELREGQDEMTLSRV